MRQHTFKPRRKGETWCSVCGHGRSYKYHELETNRKDDNSPTTATLAATLRPLSQQDKTS
jgi:hypothetical protein